MFPVAGVSVVRLREREGTRMWQKGTTLEKTHESLHGIVLGVAYVDCLEMSYEVTAVWNVECRKAFVVST